MFGCSILGSTNTSLRPRFLTTHVVESRGLSQLSSELLLNQSMIKDCTAGTSRARMAIRSSTLPIHSTYSLVLSLIWASMAGSNRFTTTTLAIRSWLCPPLALFGTSTSLRTRLWGWSLATPQITWCWLPITSTSHQMSSNSKNRMVTTPLTRTTALQVPPQMV